MAGRRRGPDVRSLVVALVQAMAARQPDRINELAGSLEAVASPEAIFETLFRLGSTCVRKSVETDRQVTDHELSSTEILADLPIQRGVREIGWAMYVEQDWPATMNSVIKHANLPENEDNDHFAGIIFELMSALGRISARLGRPVS